MPRSPSFETVARYIRTWELRYEDYLASRRAMCRATESIAELWEDDPDPHPKHGDICECMEQAQIAEFAAHENRIRAADRACNAIPRVEPAQSANALLDLFRSVAAELTPERERLETEIDRLFRRTLDAMALREERKLSKDISYSDRWWETSE